VILFVDLDGNRSQSTRTCEGWFAVVFWLDCDWRDINKAVRYI
jgi:hypothetical protein